jgi:hypothetical protein
MEEQDIQNQLFQQQNPNISIDNDTLSIEGFPYTLSLKRTEFNDDKEQIKYIKKVENIIRKSPEYGDWTRYVKEALGFFYCVISGENSSQVTVDIHHHPISMFSIVRTIVNSYVNAGKPFCSFDICQDVINLHYQNNIGFIPIIRSLHEKFHNGFLNIPMEMVKGQWTYLIDNYFIDEEDMEVITERKNISFSNCGWVRNQYTWTPASAEIQ